ERPVGPGSGQADASPVPGCGAGATRQERRWAGNEAGAVIAEACENLRTVAVGVVGTQGDSPQIEASSIADLDDVTRVHGQGMPGLHRQGVIKQIPERLRRIARLTGRLPGEVVRHSAVEGDRVETIRSAVVAADVPEGAGET